jgi:type VI protein secretion system component VasF
MSMRPEVRCVLAQASSPPPAPSQESAGPAKDASAQSDAAEPAAKQDAQTLPAAGPPRHQIVDDSANLLKLANRLKAEVDNTTADTLSITAIRDVQAIEKLAHKMRTQ